MPLHEQLDDDAALERENKAKGMPGGQVITIEKVELNPTIADDLFAMPKKAEAPAAEAKKE